MSKRGKHAAIFHLLKAVASWHERLEQKVWGLAHDLSDDATDIDELVHERVRWRPWEQLHSISDPDCISYTVVD